MIQEPAEEEGMYDMGGDEKAELPPKASLAHGLVCGFTTNSNPQRGEAMEESMYDRGDDAPNEHVDGAANEHVDDGESMYDRGDDADAEMEMNFGF